MSTTTLTSPVTSPANDKSLKAFVKRQPLLSMYIIMFGLAWSVMIPQALYSQGVISAPLPKFLGIVTGWAPGIAALIVSAAIAGRAGVKDLLRGFLTWRVGIQWYLSCLLLMAAIISGGIGLHILFGGAMPVIPVAGAPLLTILLSFGVLILAGVLINTEEIAWRGFALPRLQARYNVLVACLLLAIPEALLHLPLFWDKGNPFFQTVGIYWFSAFTVAAVFIYAYAFNKTKGSLLILTLLHASQNAWANLLSDNAARPFYFTVALTWMIALALILLTKGQLGYKAE